MTHIESTRLVLHALDAVAEGILITGSAEDDCPIIYANAAIERLTGYRRPELLGKNCRILQGPETDMEEVRRLADAVRAGRPISTILLNYRRDGTTFWNQVSIYPVRDTQGRVSHLIGVQEDVSARVTAESELRRIVQRYRLLMDHAPCGIYVLDRRGCFTDLNRAAVSILAWPSAAIRGAHFSDFVVREDQPVAVDAFERGTAGQASDLEIELCIVREDGEQRQLVVTVTAVDHDSIQSVYGIARDVTEERARERHLRRERNLHQQPHPVPEAEVDAGDDETLNACRRGLWQARLRTKRRVPGVSAVSRMVGKLLLIHDGGAPQIRPASAAAHLVGAVEGLALRADTNKWRHTALVVEG